MRRSGCVPEKGSEAFLHHDQAAGGTSGQRKASWNSVRCTFHRQPVPGNQQNAIDTAAKLKSALKEKNYQFFLDSPTNQIFVVLENQKMEELGKKMKYGFWEKYDDNHTVVRFATSWATKMEDIDALIEIL